MPLEDTRGISLTGTAPAALELFEAALDDVLSFHGDPIGRSEAALAADPTLVSAHLLQAHLLAFSLHPGLLPKAEASLEAAAGATANDRERAHARAIRAWLAGEIEASRAAFDAILEDHPRDLMALMFAHQADFFGAAESALVARPQQALAAWGSDTPGRSYVEAMVAFGLEEAGRFAEAEAMARAALAANPRDGWAIHAVAHVLEMQGRDDEGIAWYAERRADWAEDCFFAVHNWWHWALYHIDRDEPAAALALYDAGLAPDRRSITLNLCDAASLLWRLALAGHDTDDRFAALADAFDRPAREPVHVFNDVHAMLAFVGAGRRERAVEHLAGLEAAAERRGRHAAMLGTIGIPVGLALLAFADGRYAEALAGLERAMPEAGELTGSKAQRDVLAMTLIEAALRAGAHRTAERLLRARLAQKPTSARIARDLARST
jgi:tetratricopeptide (TPR) repeat protein